MKKLIIFFSALALISSCAKMEETGPVQNDQSNDSEALKGGLPEVLYASVVDEQNPETRTYMATNKTVQWEPGDAVSFFYGYQQNARYVYNGDYPDKKVELKLGEYGTAGAQHNYSRGIYPYDPNITVETQGEVDKIHVNYPAVQTYAPNSFGRGANLMIATGDNPAGEMLHFRNACGYLVIKLYGNTTVKNITLSSVSGVDKISGGATIITDENDIPMVTMSDGASTVVTLDCSNNGGVALSTNKNDPTEFWFALPPVNIKGGIKIVVTDMSGNIYTKQTTKDVNISRNNVQPMAPLQFVSNTPASNQIWYTKTAEAMAEDGKNPITFGEGQANPFDATINEHKYDESAGKFVIVFDAPVKTIKKKAFYQTEIETIELPDGLETIEESGLGGMWRLKEITIPGSVNTIGVNAFEVCYALEKITFLPSPTKTPLNIAYLIDMVLNEYGPFYYSKLTSINLNREFVYVNKRGEPFEPDENNEGIFYTTNYDSIESVSVTIGGQVRTISDFMFSCLHIQSLTIPGTVTTIGNDVFNGCDKLASITFEPSPTDQALTLGYNTMNEEDGPFLDSPLTKVNLDREIIYTLENIDLDADDEGIFSGRPLTDGVTLGNHVRTLSPYMFSNSGITSLKIPGSVTTIGNNVFNGCDKLASITFEPSPTDAELTLGYNVSEEEGPFLDSPLTKVNLDREIIYTLENIDPDEDDEGIFSGRPLTGGVTLGNHVRTLSPYMFSNSGITSLKIPASVEEIKDNVFYNCKSLASVRFEAGSEPLTIGFQPGSDEVGPFFQSPLTNIYVDRELVASESYAAARDQWDEGIFSTSFYDDDDPKVTVTLQGNVKTISDYMFSGVQMETIWIPREVETICKGAFYYCYRLYGMTLAHSGTFPRLIEDDTTSDGGGAFKWTLLNDPGLNNNERWIALEDGSDENVKKLKGSSNWSYYAYIIQAQKK